MVFAGDRPARSPGNGLLGHTLLRNLAARRAEMEPSEEYATRESRTSGRTNTEKTAVSDTPDDAISGFSYRIRTSVGSSLTADGHFRFIMLNEGVTPAQATAFVPVEDDLQSAGNNPNGNLYPPSFDYAGSDGDLMASLSGVAGAFRGDTAGTHHLVAKITSLGNDVGLILPSIMLDETLYGAGAAESDGDLYLTASLFPADAEDAASAGVVDYGGAVGIIEADTWFVFTMSWEVGSKIKVSLNKRPIPCDFLTVPRGLPTSVGSGPVFGAIGGLAEFSFLECLFYPRKLSQSELRYNENYLMARYGV